MRLTLPHACGARYMFAIDHVDGFSAMQPRTELAASAANTAAARRSEDKQAPARTRRRDLDMNIKLGISAPVQASRVCRRSWHPNLARFAVVDVNAVSNRRRREARSRPDYD
ncbi:hypothetical protein EVAR_49740_1 [Eumeta japonica]|uniref:Uncharacterized protein n=1 Tax=Eumeta variegata TaxID=151549 RepID=A0A4C1YAU1_EUMVA|nr:hypothetical protein EVAR_49740_1 [Eumeta japonica]